MIIAYYKSPKCGVIYIDQRRAMCMNTRRFIHNPKGLLHEGKRIVNQSGDTKYILRVTMVNFMLLCYNVLPQQQS